MSLKVELELDTDTLDFPVKSVELAPGDTLSWQDLVLIADSINRLLHRRESLEAIRAQESRRRGRE